MKNQELEQLKQKLSGIKSDIEKLIAPMTIDNPARPVAQMAVDAIDKDLQHINEQMSCEQKPKPQTFGEFVSKLVGKTAESDAIEQREQGTQTLQLEIRFGGGVTKLDALKLARKKLKEFIAAEEKSAG